MHNFSSRLVSKSEQTEQVFSNDHSAQYICVCVYTCVSVTAHVYVYKHIHAHACMWMREVNIQCLPQSLSTLFWGDFIIINYIHVYVLMCAHEQPWRAEGWDPPRNTGTWKLTDAGSGNWTWVLCKSSLSSSR